MKLLLFAGLVSLTPGVVGSAAAQRPIVLPRTGWGEKLAPVAELPPAAREKVRAALGRDMAVGYRYETAFVGGPGFVLWTYPGEYVLCDDREYYVLTGEEWLVLLGPDGAAGLGKPLGYRVPVGLVILLAVAGAIAGAAYTSARARARRLLKHDTVQEALSFFVAALPTDIEPTPEQKREALDKAIAYLEAVHGVPRDRATAALRLVVGEAERAYSYDLRDQAAPTRRPATGTGRRPCTGRPRRPWRSGIRRTVRS